MSPIVVPDIDSDVDPLFVLVQRDQKRRRRLVGFEVSLHHDVLADLRAIGEDALTTLQNLEERNYEPTAELEHGEQCFSISVADLPASQHEDGAVQTENDSAGVADLLGFVSNPTGLDSFSAANLVTEKFLAYGILLTDVNGQRAGFFRQTDPARPVRNGRIFGRFTDLLRKVDEPPNLILYSDIDVVVTSQRIFAMRKAAFDRLLADVDVALSEVEESVGNVSTILGTQMPLVASAAEVVRKVASRRPSFALRLRRLGVRAQQLANAGVTGVQIRDAIIAVDGNPADLLNDNDEFDFQEDGVGAFLDVLEGRWFKDSLGGEPRRADRYSRRGP